MYKTSVQPQPTALFRPNDGCMDTIYMRKTSRLSNDDKVKPYRKAWQMLRLQLSLKMEYL